MSVKGTVYLLHFETPYKHAGHYIGWTKTPAEERMALHVSGRGSPLVKAAVGAGSNVLLVMTWEDEDRHFERALKERHNAKGICPKCRAAYNEKARNRMRETRANARSVYRERAA